MDIPKFFSDIADELGLAAETEDKLPEEFLMSAESDNLRLSYQKYRIGEDYPEIFSARREEGPEVVLTSNPEKNFRLGLPSSGLANYLNRLDRRKELQRAFIEQFEKRDDEEDGVLLEYATIKGDLKPAKELIYAVFLIRESYEEVANDVNVLIHGPHYNSGNEMIFTLCDFYRELCTQGRQHFIRYVNERLKQERNPNVKDILEEVCKEVG
jgi:hypothetical protein